MGYAVFRCIIDYKILFRGKWEATPEGKAERHEAYENCHRKCAIRIREVLRTNGGIYIKVGHSVTALPRACPELTLPSINSSANTSPRFNSSLCPGHKKCVPSKINVSRPLWSNSKLSSCRMSAHHSRLSSLRSILPLLV